MVVVKVDELSFHLPLALPTICATGVPVFPPLGSPVFQFVYVSAVPDSPGGALATNFQPVVPEFV